MKKRILFVITQFYKGGAETALLNLLKNISHDEYDVDLLIHDQVYIRGYVCLIDKLPDWVNVFNASKDEMVIIAYGKKALKKIVLRITKKLISRKSAKQFVSGKHYDIAFNYGEWMPPEFIATKVKADKKYNWVHGDLDKVDYLDSKVFWTWDKYYDGYIFVSKASMYDSIKAFPGLKGRSFLIHNMCDEQEVLKLSRELVELPDLNNKHLLVTVANFRKQKNHFRQLEVMRILKNDGFNIMWLNIGGSVDIGLISRLKAKIKEYGLEDSFILKESDPNPYKYMAIADAVTVLSDNESWSLVITEAKILGIPVIATPTSGALEQITHGENGIIVEQDAGKIAAAIEGFLTDTSLQERLRKNLKGFSQVKNTLLQWNELVGGRQ
jgi:glycosyltransferase involved in cell wall biosynthesis